MADFREVIELVIRARDDTAAAFTQAAANQQKFNKILDEQGEKLRKQQDDYLQSTSSIRRSVAEVRQEMKSLGATNKEILDAQVKVQKSAEAVSKVYADDLATARDRLQKEENLRVAREKLARLQVTQSTEAKAHNRVLEQQEAILRRRADVERQIAVHTASNNRALVDVFKQQQEELQKQTDSLNKQLATTTKQLRAETTRARNQALRIADTEIERRKQEEILKTHQQIEATAQKYVKAFDSRNVERYRADLDRMGTRLTKLGVEADGVAKQLSQVWDERKVFQYEQAQASANAALSKAQKENVRLAREYGRELDSLARKERERERIGGAIDLDSGERARMDRSIELSRSRLEQLAKDISINLGFDGGKINQEADSVQALKRSLGRDVTFDINVDPGEAIAALAVVDRYKQKLNEPVKLGFFSELKRDFEETTNQVAVFDNFMRGLFTLGVVVFFNQLIVAVGAAAGELTALAGSATFAAGAIGGTLTAGIAQALPVLGVFALAMQGISSAMKAAQQGELAQQQAFQKQQKAANGAVGDINKLANATDSVRSAQESLAAAHERVRESQGKVSEARKEAVRQLDDLIFKEREAELAARGASLSVEEAQERLRRNLSAGRTGELDRNRLDVESARLNQTRSERDLQKLRSEIETRQRQGVEGSPEVRDAKKQLDNAERSATQAARGLERANRALQQAKTGADEAGAAVGAAASKQDFLMSQMSESQRALSKEISEFLEVIRVQGATISDPITESMTRGLARVNELLRDPEIIESARSLSEGVGEQLDRVFEHLLSDSSISDLTFLSQEAKANLEPLTDIALNLADAFVDIAEAASPALRLLLDYLDELTTRFEHFTGSAEGQRSMEEFFIRGVGHLKDWLRLLGSISRLLFNVFNVGGAAKSGQTGIQNFTDSVDRLNDRVTSLEGSKKLQEFFERSRRIMGALLPILSAVFEGFGKLFTQQGEENVRAFANIFADTFIPAFTLFLETVGVLTRVMSAFLDLPVVGESGKWVIAFLLVIGTLSKLQVIFSPMTRLLEAFFKFATGRLSMASAAVDGHTGRWARLRAMINATKADAARLTPVAPVSPAGAAGRTSPGGVILPPGANPSTPKPTSTTRGGISGLIDRGRNALRGSAGARLAGVGVLGAGAGVLLSSTSNGVSGSNVAAAALSGGLAGSMFGPVGAAVGALGGGAVNALVSAFRGNNAKKAEQAAKEYTDRVTAATERSIRAGQDRPTAERIGAARVATRDTSREISEREARARGLQRSINALGTGQADSLARLGLQKQLDKELKEIEKLRPRAQAQGKALLKALNDGLTTGPSFQNARGIIDRIIKPFERDVPREMRRQGAQAILENVLAMERQGRISHKDVLAVAKRLGENFGLNLRGDKAAEQFLREFGKNLRLREIQGDLRRVADGVTNRLGDLMRGLKLAPAFDVRTTLTNIRRQMNRLRRVINDPNASKEQREAAKAELSKLETAYDRGLRDLAKTAGKRKDQINKEIDDLISKQRELRLAASKPIQFTLGPLKDLGAGKILSGIAAILATPATGKNTERRASGGIIEGNPALGDVVPVLVKPGEVILNEHQQALAGRDAIYAALRATNAPTSFHSGRGYATGAGVGTPGVGRGGANKLSLALDLAGVVSVLDAFGTVAYRSWDKTWDRVVRRTGQARDSIDARMRGIVRDVDESQDKIGQRLVRGWSNINDQVRDKARGLRRSIANTMDNVQSTVYTGMKYVGTATNDALKAFDAKPAKLSIQAPKGMRAATGYMGHPGERGEDAIPIWVGRGEAVLNWAQQRAVNAAMAGRDSLDNIFKRTKAYHAGNASSGVSNGFAGGGFTGDVKGAGVGFVPLMRYLNSKAGPIYVMSGLRPGSRVAGSGRLSNHSGGNAVDITAPGIEGASAARRPETLNAEAASRMDKLHQFMGRYIQPRIGLDFLWRTDTGGNHWNHIHQGIQAAYSHSVEKMRKFIATLPEGDAFAAGGENGELPNLKVKGAGPLKRLVQKAVDKALKAAESLINKNVSDLQGVMGDVDAHDFPAGTYGKSQLADLWKQAGGPPGIANLMAAIALAESSGRSDAIGVPTSGGRARGLWQIMWPLHQGRFPGMDPSNPADNAKMAVSIYKSQGLSAWEAYTRGMHRKFMATGGYADDGPVRQATLPEYARGGQLPGPEGQPVPIVAHAGEWVVNKRQQSQIARMAGVTRDRLRDMLGFTGGPQSFSGGGVIRAATGILRDPEFLRRRRQAGRTGQADASTRIVPEGDYDLNLAEFLIGIDALSGAIKLADKKLKKKGQLLQERVSRSIKALKNLTDDGGLIDQMETSIGEWVSDRARKLTEATYGVAVKTKAGRSEIARIIRGGNVMKRMSDEEVFEQEQNDRRRELRRRANMADRIGTAIERTQSGINQAQRLVRRSFGKTSERDALDRIDELEDKKKRTKAEDAELKRLKAGKAAVEKRQTLESGLVNLNKRREEAAQAIADEIAAMYEAQLAEFQRQSEKAIAGVTAGGRNMRQLDLAVREASAKGDTAGLVALENNRTQILDAQRVEVYKQYQAALSKGYIDTAQSLIEQYQDLQTAIQESVANRLNSMIELFEKESAKRQYTVDYAMRSADIMDRIATFGQRGASGMVRQNALIAQQANYQQDMVGLQALYNQAVAEGNVGAQETLAQRIADLTLAMAENVAAQQENTNAMRQVRIDAIAGRAAFQGGVFGSLGSLLQSVLTNTGAVDADGLKDLLNRGRGVAQTALTGFQGELFESFGVDLRGLSGAALVTAMKGIDFDSIINDLTPGRKEQFESLINSIIDNASALEQNTQQLNELNGGLNPQSFGSSAWKFFRTAIFNGMGDTLPSYTIPSFDTGGQVLRTGMAKVHSGEIIMNPAVKGHLSGTPSLSNLREGDININVESVEGKVPVSEIAARMAFERRSRRK